MHELNDVDVALAAADAGADVVRRRTAATSPAMAKSGRDFATDADVDAERAILDVLMRNRPDDQVVGEESGESAGSGARRWLVDPLCGTLNFAAQNSTGLGQRRAGQMATGPSAAVSADPFAGERFWSDGARAFTSARARDEPITPRQRRASST